MSDLSLVEVYSSPGVNSGAVFQVIDGQIQFSYSLEELRQRIRNLLVTWLGQWFGNNLYGINYSAYIGKNNFVNLISEIQNGVLNIPDVSGINNLNVSYNAGILSISIDIVASNQVLNINFQQSIN